MNQAKANGYAGHIDGLAKRISIYHPDAVVVLLVSIEDAVLAAIDKAEESLGYRPKHIGTTKFPLYHRSAFLAKMREMFSDVAASFQGQDVALRCIEKALALLESVHTVEGTDKDTVEHLLRTAQDKLK